jgi:hypothetical protein
MSRSIGMGFGVIRDLWNFKMIDFAWLRNTGSRQKSLAYVLKFDQKISLPMQRLLVLLVLLAGSPAVIAQPVAPKQATPQQVRRFVANFQLGVSKGCLGNPPKDVASPVSYCNCYARSFVDRYSPGDLVAINNQATNNPQSAYTINLMMKPESRACGASQSGSTQ